MGARTQEGLPTMAGRTHGRNGVIYADPSSGASAAASLISYINEWTLDQATDKVEVTSFGDTTKTYVQGLPDASGSLNGFLNIGTTAFTNLTNNSGARKLYLYPDSGTTGTYFFCTAYFDANYTGSTGDALKVSMNWSAASAGAWVSGP